MAPPAISVWLIAGLLAGTGGHRVEFRRDGAAGLGACRTMAHRSIRLPT